MLKRKVARSFDEERPPLGEERLERVEVDDGRVGLDLAEVRVDRGRQRQARGQRVLEVGADRALPGSGDLRTGCPASDGCVDHLRPRCRAPPRGASGGRARSAGRPARRSCDTNPLAPCAMSGHVDGFVQPADLPDDARSPNVSPARACRTAAARTECGTPPATLRVVEHRHVPHGVPALVARCRR